MTLFLQFTDSMQRPSNLHGFMKYQQLWTVNNIVLNRMSYNWHLFAMLSLAPNSRRPSWFGFHLLSVPRVKTRAGTRTFSVAIPTLWNSLSEQVKSSYCIVSFSHHLKTHLFKIAHPSYVSQASDHLLMNFTSCFDYLICIRCIGYWFYRSL